MESVLFSVVELLSAASIDKLDNELYEELYTVHKSLTLPDASRITVPPIIIAITKYDNDVSKIASNVPFGIAVCGSCKTAK